MLKQNRYSTIRNEPPNPSTHTLTGFYDFFTKPGTLFGVFASIILVLGPSLKANVANVLVGAPEALIFITLIVLFLVVVYRVMQSLFLAKRDYSSVDSGFGDILIFIFVLACFIGLAALLTQQNTLWSLIAFTILALVGLIYFFDLWNRRMSKDNKGIEYQIERRIQLVNTLVCLYCFAVLNGLIWQYYKSGPHPFSVMAWVGTVISALIFNILHSHQLTLLPKFLMKNDPDSPKELVNIFKEIYWRTAKKLEEDDILKLFSKDAGTDFRSIETVRASSSNVPTLVDCLAHHFPQVVTRIFGTQKAETLKQILTLLLTAGGGLGPLGYMHFYMLKQDRHYIGFIKTDTSHSCWLYELVAAFVTVFGLRKIFGIREVWRIYRRWKVFNAAQPGPCGKEVRLTYILIFPEFQGRGNGKTVVRFLINALLRDWTNDISASCITLFVRKKNEALRLFLSTGFTPVDMEEPFPNDPYADDDEVGPALFLQYLRPRI